MNRASLAACILILASAAAVQRCGAPNDAASPASMRDTLSVERLSDGTWLVTCVDGSRERHTEAELRNDSVCQGGVLMRVHNFSGTFLIKQSEDTPGSNCLFPYASIYRLKHVPTTIDQFLAIELVAPVPNCDLTAGLIRRWDVDLPGVVSVPH
jgi:hypothetical protein